MPVPSTVADLSSTASSNYPGGSEAIGTSLDDYLRAHASIIKQVSDSKADTAHTHVSTAISDSTAAGRSLLTAADAAAQRTALGLGTAATATAGTAANNLVQLDGTAKLPAVDGSQLTNLPAALPSQTGNAGKYLTTNGETASWNDTSAYTSAITPIPAAGVSLTASHSLGVIPVHVTLEFTCITAEQGYSVGDVVQVQTNWTGTAYSVKAIWKNTTQVGWLVQSGTDVCLPNKSTGADFTPTKANWSYRFCLRVR